MWGKNPYGFLFLCNLLQFKNFPIHIQIGLIFFFSNVLYLLFFKSINTPHLRPPPQLLLLCLLFTGASCHPGLCKVAEHWTEYILHAGTLCSLLLTIHFVHLEKKSNFSVQFHFTPEFFYTNPNPFKPSLGESVTLHCHFCRHRAMFFMSYA